MNKSFVFIFINLLLLFSVIKSFSQNAEEYSETGFRKFANQDYVGAIKDYNSAIELNPKNDNYYIIRGYSNFKINKFNEAIEDFNKAIEICPNLYSYYLKRALAKKYIGDKEGACSDFKKYLEISGLSSTDELKNFCGGIIGEPKL
jgi:tetratricopeptide (TPR) repeat protein